MKNIDSLTVETLLIKARQSPRKRAHHNLHPTLEDAVQRLCIAACKGTYIRPHRHPEPYKWEMFIILSGAAAMILFDEQGRVTERIELLPDLHSPVVEVAPAVWHTLVITSAEAVLIEVKPGPYTPLSDKDFASWAPAEQDQNAQEFEFLMRSAKNGDQIGVSK